jgi:hypothetical protein
MALLQALLALIGRAAGRILNALFSWAVRALFGFVTGAQKALLTGVVALAALWPLLALGVAFPRVAAFLVAFVPLSDRVPDFGLRLVWLGLALFAPTLLGVVLASRSARAGAHESLLVRAARGYPTTLALALAFWISFFSVPVQRLVSALRRRSEVYVPLITTEAGYAEAAQRIEQALNAQGFGVERREPGFWKRLPTRILARLAGRALAQHVPSELAHLAGPELEATLYPAGLVLSGREGRTPLARGIVVEALASSNAFQTTTPKAQDLERKIRRVWRSLELHSPYVESPELERRLDEIREDIAALAAPDDDWQAIYRKALQLEREADGAPQYLAAKSIGRVVPTTWVES